MLNECQNDSAFEVNKDLKGPGCGLFKVSTIAHPGEIY